MVNLFGVVLFSFAKSSAFQREPAGSGEFQNPEGFEQPEERVDFVVVAGELNDEILVRKIDDLGAENVGDLNDLGTRFGACANFNQHQFTSDRLALGEINH